MKRGVYIFWSIFVAVAIFRIWQSFGVEPPDIGNCVRQNVQGSGIIADEPERKESGQVFVVSVLDLNIASTSKACAVDFQIRLKTKLYPRFVFGEQVSFKGKLLQPVNFSSGSDRTFDYRGYLAKDDIYYEMKSAIVAAVDTNKVQNEKSSQNIFSIISSQLFSLKRNFVSNLEKTLGEPHAALAAGLVVGEKAALGKDLLNDFRAVGLIHIVVLSGYNITIVADAMRRLLSFLPRLWGISVGGIGIALFGILVGGGATVVRSCLMAGIALFADIIRRDYSVIHTLMFVGLLMLIENPMILLHDPSFQLSFLATLGLILLASPIEKRLGFVTEKFGIRGIVASTIATQIFVSPYILYMMGQISMIGMVVNILVLPFIPITMLLVSLTGVIGIISLPVAQFFGWGSYLLLSYELFMVGYFADIPFASAQVKSFSFWWVVGFYAGFCLIYWHKSMFCVISSIISVKSQVECGIHNRLQETLDELDSINNAGLILQPNKRIFITLISEDNMHVLKSKSCQVFISRRSIKHILERRKSKKDIVFNELIDVITKPTKIIDNSIKRNNSFLFIRSGKVIVATVIEITEKPGDCQVVSAFLMDRKTYEKLIDISGRAEFPPFELSS